MAQDALQVAQRVTGLRWQAPELISHPDGGSASASPVSLTQPPGLHLYGPLQDQVRATQGADVDLGLGLSEAMVRHAVRHEQACTVQDVLARRHRMLFLDARLAQEVAPQVSEFMMQEGVSDPQLSAFLQTCQQYQI
jgi:glycerol-3-phosphate dehydrogenase